MEEGYIQLPASLFESSMFKERRVYSEFEAWLYLIHMANLATKPEEVTVYSKTVIVMKGEVAVSRSILADRFGWTDKKVRCFLSKLEKAGYITSRTSSSSTIVKVSENYLKGQAWGQAKGQANPDENQEVTEPKGQAWGQAKGQPKEERNKTRKEEARKEINKESKKDYTAARTYEESLEDGNPDWAPTYQQFMVAAELAMVTPERANYFWNWQSEHGWLDHDGHPLRFWRATLGRWRSEGFKKLAEERQADDAAILNAKLAMFQRKPKQGIPVKDDGGKTYSQANAEFQENEARERILKIIGRSNDQEHARMVANKAYQYSGNYEDAYNLIKAAFVDNNTEALRVLGIA